MPDGGPSYLTQCSRFGSDRQDATAEGLCFVVYQAQHEQAKREYPEGPAAIRWVNEADGEVTFFLHIGPGSALIAAKSSFKDDLLAFAKRHGWEIHQTN